MLTMNKAIKLLDEAYAMQRENAASHARTTGLRDVLYDAAVHSDYEKLIEVADELSAMREKRIANLQAVANRFAKIKEAGFLIADVKMAKARKG